MDIQKILARYDREVRIDLEEPGLEREVLPQVVRLIRRRPPMGFIRHSRLDETNADRIIQEQIACFRSLDMPFEWEVCAYDQPGDLKERLLSHGFQPDQDAGDPGAVLVLDLNEAPTSLLQSGAAVVRRVESPDGLSDVIRVIEQVWGGNFSWLRARFAAHLEIPGYLALFVAFVREQPASCGWTYYYPGSRFAILRGGSTLPEFRGQGLYSAMLSARLRHAARRGYRYLTVDAAPTSRPILEKRGFQLLTYSLSFKWGMDPQVRKGD